jgi:hypothetical protein
MLSRPSETIQAVVGTILGAILIIAGAFADVSKFTPQVVGAIVLLVSYVAAIVTAVVASKQRSSGSTLTSATDGSVSKTSVSKTS